MMRKASTCLLKSTNLARKQHLKNISVRRMLSTQYQQQQQQQPDKIDNRCKKGNVYVPGEGYICNSIYPEIVLPNTTVEQFVWRNINKWEKHIAATCGVTGRQYTYAQLRDSSAKFAIQLQKKFNMKQGETCAVCLPNLPEFPIAVLGAIEAGLVISTVNPIYTADEIGRQLIDNEASILIGTVFNYETLKAAAKIANKNIKIICVRMSMQETLPEGAIDFYELINEKNVDYSGLINMQKAEDLCFLPYSSGTTGLPKGVELTHNNITANCDMLHAEHNVTLMPPTTADHQDVLPCVLPFFHIYGLTVTLLAKLAIGCKIVTLPTFKPDTFLNTLSDQKSTVLHIVPPIIIFLGKSDMVQPKHMEHLRVAMSGAAPMGTLDAEQFLKRAPNCEFVQGYGLTETSPVVLMGQKGNKKYSSVGHLTPNTQAKIVALNDPTNTGLGPNEVGELLVRGPQVMRGYRNNKKATDEMIIEGGWLRTGDLSYYDDDDGTFYITDRLKELIKVKGFQVPPAELEELLRGHPNIADAAVVGTPDPISGEVPRAFVVPKAGVTLTEKAIQDYIAEKVAIYKRLAGGVTFIETIPKNASGKILRRELKQKYCTS